MKKTVLLPFIFALVPLVSKAAVEYKGDPRSKGGDFGLGVMFGDPVAISGKYFLDANSAVDFAAGYGYSEDDGFQVHADYLFHPHVLTRQEDFSMSWFVGVGAAGVLGDDGNINARAPFGLTFTFVQQPIEAFLEFAPGVGIADDFGFAFDGGIGARFYF